MKSKTTLFSVAGALALTATTSGVHAGSGKVVATPPPACCAPAPLFGAEVAVGYDTHYMFRGVNYGEDSLWGSIELAVPCAPEGIDLTVGVWYQNPINGSAQNPTHEDELDLYTTIGTEVLPGLYGWVGYFAYLYPEAGGGSTDEIGAGTEVSVLNDLLAVIVEAYYDFDIEGWYFATGASHTLEICDGFAIEAGGTIGYQIDYNNPGNDWNDVRAFVKAPIALTSNATLAPYIAHSWSLNAIDSFQDDELFGGVSLAVQF